MALSEQQKEVKKAKADYKLHRKESTSKFRELRNRTMELLGKVHSKKFDCGELKIGILKS